MLVAIRNVPAQKIQLIRVLNLFSFGISCNNKQLRARYITIKTDRIPDSGSSSFRKLKTAGFAPPLCRQCFRPTSQLLSVEHFCAPGQISSSLCVGNQIKIFVILIFTTISFTNCFVRFNKFNPLNPFYHFIP